MVSGVFGRNCYNVDILYIALRKWRNRRFRGFGPSYNSIKMLYNSKTSAGNTETLIKTFITGTIHLLPDLFHCRQPNKLNIKHHPLHYKLTFQLRTTEILCSSRVYVTRMRLICIFFYNIHCSIYVPNIAMETGTVMPHKQRRPRLHHSPVDE